MAELIYRTYGLIHQLAKVLFRKDRLSAGPFYPKEQMLGCDLKEANKEWLSFINKSVISVNANIAGFYYAGYVAESQEWCLESWIWTNAALVRMYCGEGNLEKAIALGEKLSECQQECGAWIVRNDYDAKGAIPIMAPNDSAYIANNAFISLFEATKDERWLKIAIKCADWIIETARPDGLLFNGYNTRDDKWETNCVIVDTGFAGALFSKLAVLTCNAKYKEFLDTFITRYIDLFYLPEKKGFCTSIGNHNQPQGGMFARGQAWALEGLIPAYNVLHNDSIRVIIDNTIDNLMKQQCRNGGWPYNLTRKLMGEDCKAVSVIAKDMMEWYAYTKDERILNSAKRALDWCCKHTSVIGEAKGGIFSYCVEGGIVKNLYTSCAFVYASAYAIELQKQIENADNYSH